jgi:hypothetical protein
MDRCLSRVLVPDEELLRPDPKNLSPTAKALFEVLFPDGDARFALLRRNCHCHLTRLNLLFCLTFGTMRDQQ